MAGRLMLGIDAGSEWVHSVVMRDGSLAYKPRSRMHLGNPIKVVKQMIEEVTGKGFDKKDIYLSFTGSCGKTIAESIGAPYFYETITIPQGARSIDKNAKYIFHLGATTSYFFEIDNSNQDNGFFISDNSTSTKCGGGSGILLTKQCRRLFEGEVKEKTEQEKIEKMYGLALKAALKANKDIEVGGRCGVVIQSDMIHLQNRGESLSNIIKGLFARVAKNYKSDVTRIRKLDEKYYGIITGGVSMNKVVANMLGEIFSLQIKKCENSTHVAAIGAAILAANQNDIINAHDAGLENENANEINSVVYTKPLSSALKMVKNHQEEASKKAGNVLIFSKNNAKKPLVLGVDGGSTTTKAALVSFDPKKRKLGKMVASICIETHGRPVEAAQSIFKELKKALGKNLDIRAVGYTGSSGSLYFRLFTDSTKDKDRKNIDLIKDEITCHALGVKQFNPEVDTIFELGGQDAKFTIFRKDSVKKSKMNLSCMAGTGQTMQNMIKMIGLDFDEFDKYALRAKRTPVVDDSCGVFTEIHISKLVGLGLPKEEIAAAIAYGCIGGYIHKFVGNEHLGTCISAQGGPFRSKACLAALALLTDKKINAFPHRQLFGAYGAAIAAFQNATQDE